MTYLTHLEIFSMRRTSISVSLLNTIHQTCAYLEHICLKSTKIQVPEKIELDSGKQHSNLKTIKLYSLNAIYRHSRWLQYAANQYPKLETIVLKCKNGGEIITDQRPAKFYDRLFSSCPLLVRFEWRNIIPDDMFLERLGRKQQQLQKLSLRNTRLVKKIFLEIKPHRYIYLSNILNLKIDIPEIIPSNTLIEFLSQACPQLQQLKLNGDDSPKTARIYIDSVLDLFPCLVSIGLIACQVSVGKSEFKHLQPQDFSPHKLNKIDCTGSFISEHFFDYIALRCPNLQYLSLLNTRHPEQQYKIKICLPYQKLYKLEIKNVRIERNNALKLSELFHINLEHRSDWYYNCRFCFEDGNSFVKMNKTDIHVFKSTLAHLCKLRQSLARVSSYYIGRPPSSVFDQDNICITISRGYIDLTCKSVNFLYIDSINPNMIDKKEHK
ncbi:hypothetical protein BD560DRAFT_491504 [Blakeslea trispora]|nr:hypothetical protein BD560DRAFT_491504 [Blakeslea trispora]